MHIVSFLLLPYNRVAKWGKKLFWASADPEVKALFNFSIDNV